MSLENDLLVSVSKYPASEKSPRENFFTECFRYILANDQKLLKSFAYSITDGRLTLRSPLRIESQVRLKNSIVDLVISDGSKKKRILIEVKIDARENQEIDEDSKEPRGQVQKYLDESKSEDRVCIISLHDETPVIKRHLDRYLDPRNWKAIYRLIERHYETGKHGVINKYIANNFLELMEHFNMMPFKGFEDEDIRQSKTRYMDLYEKLFGFLKNIKSNDEIKKFIGRNGFTCSGKTPRYYEDDQFFQLEFQKRVRQGKKWRVYSICFGFEYYPTVKGWEDYFPCSCTPPRAGTTFWSCLWTPKETCLGLEKNHKPLPVSKKYFCAQYSDNFVLYNQVHFSDFAKDGADNAMRYVIRSLEELEKKGILKIVEKEMMRKSDD
jgi:hypothetical protein